MCERLESGAIPNADRPISGERDRVELAVVPKGVDDPAPSRDAVVHHLQLVREEHDVDEREVEALELCVEAAEGLFASDALLEAKKSSRQCDEWVEREAVCAREVYSHLLYW